MDLRWAQRDVSPAAGECVSAHSTHIDVCVTLVVVAQRSDLRSEMVSSLIGRMKPTHPIQAAQVLHLVLVCVGLVVDDGVLLVHAAGLNRTESSQSPRSTPISIIPPGWRRRLVRTCSISSQSSLPTKIISLGRRWRVPLPLTRNQEVRLISASPAHRPTANASSWKQEQCYLSI